MDSARSGAQAVADLEPVAPQRRRPVDEMKRSLGKRVERLERERRFQAPPPPSAKDLHFWPMAQELLRQLDQKYATLVQEDFARGDPRQFSALTMAVASRVLDHLEEDRPLAFPPAVAAAYVENPDARESASCQDCRYRLPWGYFKLCPLCGGQVGYVKHGMTAPTGTLDSNGCKEAKGPCSGRTAEFAQRQTHPAAT